MITKSSVIRGDIRLPDRLRWPSADCGHDRRSSHSAPRCLQIVASLSSWFLFFSSSFVTHNVFTNPTRNNNERRWHCEYRRSPNEKTSELHRDEAVMAGALVVPWAGAGVSVRRWWSDVGSDRPPPGQFSWSWEFRVPTSRDQPGVDHVRPRYSRPRSPSTSSSRSTSTILVIIYINLRTDT